MRCGHDGLSAIALKEGVDTTKLGLGDMLCFINGRKNKIKVFAATSVDHGVAHNPVVAYYRQEHGRIDEMAIQHIPQAFSGEKFEMKKAITKALMDRLGK